MIDICEIQNVKIREQAKHWLSIFEDWQKSNLPRVQYYKIKNIAPSSAYYWFKFLKGQAPSPYPAKKNPLKKKNKDPQLQFIALETPAPAAPTSLVKDKGNCLDTGLKIVLTSGLFLSIEKNFDAISLSRVLSILEGRCL
jgi:hypothetical protein